MTGAGILKALTPDGLNESLCTPTPAAGVSIAQTFGYELLLTFVLVMTVFATCDWNRSGIGGSGPLAIGLAIAMCHLWAVRTAPTVRPVGRCIYNFGKGPRPS